MSDLKQVREESLTSRQQSFLTTLKKHDQRVVVLRDNGRLIFKGPVIGEGPMPSDEPEPKPGSWTHRVSGLQFRGRDWAGVKRRLSNHYAQLTEEDLAYVPGEEDALLNRMARRTMESPENLNRFLREQCGCLDDSVNSGRDGDSQA
jgi:hypothetical protein